MKTLVPILAIVAIVILMLKLTNPGGQNLKKAISIQPPAASMTETTEQIDEELPFFIDEGSLPLYSDEEAQQLADAAATLKKDIVAGRIPKPKKIEDIFEQLNIDKRKLQRGFDNIGGATEWRTYKVSTSYTVHATILLPDVIGSFEIRRNPVEQLSNLNGHEE